MTSSFWWLGNIFGFFFWIFSYQIWAVFDETSKRNASSQKLNLVWRPNSEAPKQATFFAVVFQGGEADEFARILCPPRFCCVFDGVYVTPWATRSSLKEAPFFGKETWLDRMGTWRFVAPIEKNMISSALRPSEDNHLAWERLSLLLFCPWKGGQA